MQLFMEIAHNIFSAVGLMSSLAPHFRNNDSDYKSELLQYDLKSSGQNPNQRS